MFAYEHYINYVFVSEVKTCRAAHFQIAQAHHVNESVFL